ncbi:arginine deiminase family protein [Variovorax ureilyticus]|uniref:arginine deiminase family protein n=1 Tax=Variovorax ureilyticus TaxID=1836198 RepID=UPI003D67D812
MVCAPGRAHQRLTPSNCDELLFDDVLWVENAKRDHFDFVTKMRDRGVEVVEMHNLLAETVAVPEGKRWILDNRGRAQPGGPGLHRRAAQLPRRPERPRAGRDADRRPLYP